MKRTYSSVIKKLSKEAFLKWYPFRDGLGESEYERIHHDGTGLLRKGKGSKQPVKRAKKAGGKGKPAPDNPAE